VIISHRHRYLFVELPRTGSSAIRQELIRHYGGQPILYKHATYEEFLRVASDEGKRYFVFSCIRNPLDDAVSLYSKISTNHKNKFRSQREGSNLIDRLSRRLQGKSVPTRPMDFPQFFLRWYKFPYDQWSSLSHRNFDYVIRFENLAADFEEVLRRLELPHAGPLPVANRTARKRDFTVYYTPRIIDRAKRVFGPYMHQWGYQFPPGWGDSKVSRITWVEFRILRVARLFYWTQLRPLLHSVLRRRRSTTARRVVAE